MDEESTSFMGWSINAQLIHILKPHLPWVQNPIGVKRFFDIAK
jgi:hypothetical protein